MTATLAAPPTEASPPTRAKEVVEAGVDSKAVDVVAPLIDTVVLLEGEPTPTYC